MAQERCAQRNPNDANSESSVRRGRVCCPRTHRAAVGVPARRGFGSARVNAAQHLPGEGPAYHAGAPNHRSHKCDSAAGLALVTSRNRSLGQRPTLACAGRRCPGAMRAAQGVHVRHSVEAGCARIRQKVRGCAAPGGDRRGRYSAQRSRARPCAIVAGPGGVPQMIAVLKAAADVAPVLESRPPPGRCLCARAALQGVERRVRVLVDQSDQVEKNIRAYDGGVDADRPRHRAAGEDDTSKPIIKPAFDAPARRRSATRVQPRQPPFSLSQ
jgi:hypothetical protein